MNTDLHQAAEQYVGVVNGQMVCHTGIIQFPMRKGWKRVHRLVVLPDYQGCGIGKTFINEVAKLYTDKGLRVNLTTTTPSLVHGLCKDSSWALVRSGRTQSKVWQGYENTAHIGNTKSSKRVTYSFNYKK